MIIIYYDAQGNITSYMRTEKILSSFADPRPHLITDVMPDIDASRVDMATLQIVPK